MGWLEDERQRLQEEREEACRREYQRLVADGWFKDSDESRTAFVYGWFGEVTYKQAKNNLQRDLGGSFSLLFIALGTMLLLFMGMAIITAPSGVLIVDRIWWIAALATGLIAGGLVLLKYERRKAARLHAEFTAQWGPAEKEPVDDQDKSS